MTVKKVKGSVNWWIDVAVPDELHHIHGTRIRKSSGTTDKKQAQRAHDQLKADLWKQQHLGVRPTHTMAEAVARWKKQATEAELRSLDDVSYRLDWWVEKLGKDTPIGSIRRQQIVAAVEGKMTIPKGEWEQPRPATPATINRYLQAIRGLLRKAVRWDWLDSAPEVTLLKEPKGRVRSLEVADMQRLMDELPEYWRPLYLFALATGLRKANVVELEWPQVDLAKRRLLVGSDDFKNGEDFGIPLNETAMAVLQAQEGMHGTRVFTRDGQPITELPHKQWKAALARAGITDYRWHDNRHTWATTYLEAGGDLDQLQKLGGWKSREMVARYAHMRTEHLRKAASVVDKALGGLSMKKQQVDSDDGRITA